MSDFAKVCKSCGAQLPSDSSRCFKCGAILEWKRNGFVSFWLWLGAIVSGIGIFGFLVLAEEYSVADSYWYYDSYDYGYGYTLNNLADYCYSLSAIYGVLMLGYILLLNWKKAGFWLIALVQVVDVILAVGVFEIVEEEPTFLISPITSIIILALILQIKKNDISYWKAMDLKSSGGRVATVTPAPTPAPTPAYTYRAPEPAPAPTPAPPTREYWVAVNGQKYGPYNMQQMRDMAQKGQINASMLVWAQGMPQWEVASSVPEVAVLFAQTPPTL